MPAWLEHLLTAFVTAGGVSAVFTYFLRREAERHRHQLEATALEHGQRREDRGDEVQVLQDTIGGLRTDVKALQRREQRVQDDLNTLKSEHTACLVAQERLKARLEWCEKEIKGMRGQSCGEDTPG